MHIAFDPRLRVAGPLQALDARCKILAFFALVVCAVSVPPSCWRAPAAFVGAAALLLLVSRIPLGAALKRLLFLVPVVLALAAVVPFAKAAGGEKVALWAGGPLVPRQGLLVLWNVSSKALVGLLCAIILAGTTGVPRLLEAFERLCVPRVLVLTMSFIHRYAITMQEELARMKRARDARGWRGRWIWQAGTLGSMAGTLFLRSYERGERVWQAMLARGYRGKLIGPSSAPLRLPDVMFVVWMLAAGLAIRFLVR